MSAPAFATPFRAYRVDDAYDEMFDFEGRSRPAYRELYHGLLEMPADDLRASLGSSGDRRVYLPNRS